MSDNNDPFNNQVAETIKMVFELSSRIDERCKMLTTQHADLSNRMEKVIERQESQLTRVMSIEKLMPSDYHKDITSLRKAILSLELKVNTLETEVRQQHNKWKVTGDLVFKILEVVIGGLILWKLGIK